MTKITFKIGKRTCKCKYDINEEDCNSSKMSCDKKCSGKVAGLDLEEGRYLMNIMVKKDKVTTQIKKKKRILHIFESQFW